MTTYRVGYFVGSLATASINRLLSKALVRLAPAELEMTEILMEFHAFIMRVYSVLPRNA